MPELLHLRNGGMDGLACDGAESHVRTKRHTVVGTGGAESHVRTKRHTVVGTGGAESHARAQDRT